VSTESRDTKKSRGSRGTKDTKETKEQKESTESREIIKSRESRDYNEIEDSSKDKAGKSNGTDGFAATNEGVDRIQPPVLPSFENGKVGDGDGVEPIIQTADDVKAAKPIIEPPKDRYTCVFKYTYTHTHAHTTLPPL
jgi:hypothetical protein